MSFIPAAPFTNEITWKGGEGRWKAQHASLAVYRFHERERRSQHDRMLRPRRPVRCSMKFQATAQLAFLTIRLAAGGR